MGISGLPKPMVFSLRLLKPIHRPLTGFLRTLAHEGSFPGASLIVVHEAKMCASEQTPRPSSKLPPALDEHALARREVLWLQSFKILDGQVDFASGQFHMSQTKEVDAFSPLQLGREDSRTSSTEMCFFSPA